MKRITVEVKNDIAILLLHNLENMNVIKIIEELKPEPKPKISEQLAGSLSETQIHSVQQELLQMRDEWNRNIF